MPAIDDCLRRTMTIRGAIGVSLLLYLALNRQRANLAPARHTLSRIEDDMEV